MESTNKKTLLFGGGCLVLLFLLMCGVLAFGGYWFYQNYEEEDAYIDNYSYDYDYDDTYSDTYDDTYTDTYDFESESYLAYMSCHSDAYDRYITIWDEQCDSFDDTSKEYGDNGHCLLPDDLNIPLNEVFDAESLVCDEKYPEEAQQYYDTYGYK